jgi:HAD superfamily hydrolase (TIGR01484 family)
VNGPVRLAVVDIDGCLTPGVAQEWNWEAMRAVQDLNRQARKGEAVPAVTLCTGRQAPYVEVFMQAIGAFLPGIYENGCGLYFPDGFRFVEHPSITSSMREALAAAKAMLHAQVVKAGLGYFQPGKEVSLSLFPLPGTSLHRLLQAVTDALSDHAAWFTVQTSAACVDVTPAGIDKGVGVRWLSEETGIPLAHIGGIGDSTGDLAFLRLVEKSAAPANATDEVQSAVGCVSPFADGDGVVDILRCWSDLA